MAKEFENEISSLVNLSYVPITGRATKPDKEMDTIPQDRSHLRGTGPSSYGTSPKLDIFMNI